MSEPISRSFTTQLSPDQWSTVGMFNMAITVEWRARWWKRPLLWLLRRPTRRRIVMPHTAMTGLTIDPDGGAAVTFEARGVASGPVP